MLATLATGRQLIIAGQKSGLVYALDPDKQGQQVWRYRAGGGSGLGGIQWGIAADADRAYVPVAEIYNPAPGGLHAIDLATGTRAWYAPPETPVCGKPSRACSGAQFSAVSAIAGIVFSPSNDGAVRACCRGRQDRVAVRHNRDFTTLNGVRAGRVDERPGAHVTAGSVARWAFGLRPGNCSSFGVGELRPRNSDTGTPTHRLWH